MFIIFGKEGGSMSALTHYQELVKSLSAGEPHSFYVFTGTEEWYISLASRAIIAKAFQGQDSALMSLNLVDLDGEDAQLSRVRQEIQTPPFFGGRKVVRVRQAKFFKPSKTQEGEDAKSPLVVPAAQITLICEAESVSQKSSLLKGQKVQSIDFSFPRRQDALGAAQVVVREELASSAMRIESAAASLLLELLGVNEKEPFVRTLLKETQKIMAYKNYSGTVTEKDVRALVTRSAEAKLWDVTDAITTKNSAKALKHVQEIVQDGEDPLAILGALSSFFRQALLAREMYDERLALEVAVSNLAKLNVHRFVAEKAYRAAPSFSRSLLEEWLTRCFTISQAIKLGKINAVLSLEMLICEACAR